MKRFNLAMLVVAGAAISATLMVQPANASAASDAATRYAASIYAQQQGLPANYYDVQQAMQKGYGYGGYAPYNYAPYGGYAPYAGYPGYGSYGGW